MSHAPITDSFPTLREHGAFGALVVARPEVPGFPWQLGTIFEERRVYGCELFRAAGFTPEWAAPVRRDLRSLVEARCFSARNPFKKTLVVAHVVVAPAPSLVLDVDLLGLLGSLGIGMAFAFVAESARRVDETFEHAAWRTPVEGPFVNAWALRLDSGGEGDFAFEYEHGQHWGSFPGDRGRRRDRPTVVISAVARWLARQPSSARTLHVLERGFGEASRLALPAKTLARLAASGTTLRWTPYAHDE